MGNIVAFNEDELLNDSIDLVVDMGSASASMLQRRFEIGYSRAGRIIDQMEERGLISGYDGSKPRKVLITKEEWEEMKLCPKNIFEDEEEIFVYCKHCGFRNDDTSKFCVKCGKEFYKIEESKLTSFVNNKFSKITGIENYKKKISELESTINNIHQNKINLESKKIEELQLKNNNLLELSKELLIKKDYLTSLIESLENTFIDEEYSFFEYNNINSDECQNKLSMLNLEEKELIKNDKAIITNNNDYLKVPKKSFENDKKQLLNLFNSECELLISNVSVTNIDKSRIKLNKIYELDNKLFETDYIQISKEFLKLKFEKLTLIYNYQKKKKEEQEQLKAIKQQMLEEEKVRRELEKEKQKIEKEEKQFNSEVKKLMQYLNKSQNDVEKQLYIDKINELEEKLKLLSKDKDNIINREQNTRAGFVYIISNIGSFGENVYKIGMTRRLEPMDRVKELGDASVPFEFDVHAMIFSEDAPALENLLHQHFEKNRVNKINPRKEFYKVNLEEIEKLVKEKFNSTTEFVMLPKATEYNQSK